MMGLRAFLLALFLAVVSTPLAACEDVPGAGKAYDTYRNVQKALRSGEPPAAVPGIDCFIAEDADELDAAEAYRLLVATSFRPDVLYDFLVSEQRSVFAKADRDGAPSAVLAWRGGYLGEAAITAYERTGERRFLDLFVRYFDRVLDYRDSERGVIDLFHGRRMHSWSEARPALIWYGPVPVRTMLSVSHVTHAARILLAASDFVRIVKTDPELAGYLPTADRYLDAALAALAEFEGDKIVDGKSGERWFRRPVTGEVEATNHIHTLGSVYINLAAATGDAVFRQAVDELVAVFARGVQHEDDGTVHWKYFPYFADQTIGSNGREYSEPIWKASQTAPFIFRAHQAGYAVPDELVEAMTRTLLTHVIRDNEVLRNVSPTKSRAIGPDDKDLTHLHGIVTWLEATPYDAEVADRVRDLIAGRPDLFPRGWFGSTNSARGYAFFLGGD